ncbi:MAG: cobalamin-binding protein [Chlamydiae bacterium]|nr:cobalamin-binding protein [Chlamydiota bacterium]
MKIASFLPSATEMVFSLGLGDHLIGVTHECDYPPEAKSKPIVVSSRIDSKTLTPTEIDASVTERLQKGESLYQIDENLLKKLKPDLILTQNLCQVCAPSGNEANKALQLLSPAPQILYLTPSTLEDIFQNILQVGLATSREKQAKNVVQKLRSRVDKIRKRREKIQKRPRVFFMEWLDPIYNAGHWVPEMIEIAGGRNDLARISHHISAASANSASSASSDSVSHARRTVKYASHDLGRLPRIQGRIGALATKSDEKCGLSEPGKPSIKTDWEKIQAYDPEILILGPCGFSLEDALKQAPLIKKYPGWEKISAIRNNQVYAVDANAHFARPGPRIVEGLEILTTIIHPEFFSPLLLKPKYMERIFI